MILGVLILSSLKVRQIKAKLLDMFEQYLDLSDIGHADKDREVKVLSRCLAAYALVMTTGCNPQDAAQSVWDGSDDDGIDAAFTDLADGRVVIVQSKWISAGNGEPSAADIAVFANGVKDIFEQEEDNFAVKLRPRLQAIGQALDVPGTTVEVVLISTGASQIAKHGTANLDRLLQELNGQDVDESDALVSTAVLGLNEVYSSLASDVSVEGLTLEASLLDWSKVSDPEVAYFGVIDGLQLKEWWTAYGRRLVAKNIRHALGTTDVNTQIRETALNDPDHFWYFNNGVTLIADAAVRAPKAIGSKASGNFQLKGASIVNGAQTVSTLGRVEDDERLGRVRVPIRVILLEDAPADFGAKVTRTNNLQNRVEARDFVAHDPVQTRLQQEMRIEGIDYQFLRSEVSQPSPNSCELIEVTTALACASGDSSMAVSVKTGIGRFFADLKKTPYVALFNPSTSGATAFNATLVHRSVDRWIDQKKKAIGKKSGFSWGTLIHGNRILSAAVFARIGREILTQPIAEFRAKLGDLDIDGHCEVAYTAMVAHLEANYQGKFLALLFKNPSMSKDVFDISKRLS